MKMSPDCPPAPYHVVHMRNPSSVDKIELVFGASGSVSCELTLHLKPSWVDSTATQPPRIFFAGNTEEEDVNEVLYYRRNAHGPIILMVHLGKAFAPGMHDEFMRVLSILRAKALGRWKMAIERSPRGNDSIRTRISGKIGSYLRGGQRDIARTHGRRSLRQAGASGKSCRREPMV